MNAHAKSRPPSAAKRWLSCPESAVIVPMYPNDETDASTKGDEWHGIMEDRLLFGIVASSADPDAAEAVEDLAAYVAERKNTLKATVYVEEKLDIPETGEFGTADVILDGHTTIEIIDLKSGYVPVDVKMNAQMMTYLLGVIARFGERKHYKLTIHQPNFDHIEGSLRSFEPTAEDVEWFRREVLYSVNNPSELKAGTHCKDTYCPHRGSCEAFLMYVQADLMLGWHPSEVKSIGDDMLANALDAADELAGWRTELRGEAMKRIVQMDRQIHGYKVVKGRKQRAIRQPAQLIRAIWQNLGEDYGAMLFPDLDFIADKVKDTLKQCCPTDAGIVPVPDFLLKNLGTAKHVEDVIKAYSRKMHLPRGGWQKIYENIVGEYINEHAGGLTLEKAIDGRPAHKKGNEFGAIISPSNSVTII